jgi:DNA helicase-2/ATP-dependent DNA helicase PcrA
MDSAFLDSLNPPQRDAVEHVDGPLLILAGAGSGKTRVIVGRIANLIHLGVPPWNILAVTFTNKAAAEMRHRVDSVSPGKGAGVWVSTFHSFCAKFLRIECKNIGLDPNFVIYDDGDQVTVITETLQELGIPEKQFPPRQILNVISRAKDEMLDAGSLSIHAASQDDPFRERTAKVYEVYQKKLRAANALDFGDLIMRTVESFRDITLVREKYQRRFHYVMVDEYQDTNHAQYLLTKYLAGTAKNICVVGDDDQSIYSWRGATIRNILEFERDYPGAKVVKLEQNYRSTPTILACATRLIKNNLRRKVKELWTENPDGDDIIFKEMMNEQEEARYVIEEVGRLRREKKFELKDIAVFYRTNAQSRVFEDALRRATLPYTIVGALRFYERAEIKDAMAYLRTVVNTNDTLSLRRIVNVPARGLGKNSLDLIDEFAGLNGLSLWDALKRTAEINGVSPAARNGVRSFIELIEKFQGYSRDLPPSAVVRRVLEESGYWDSWAKSAETDPEAAERLDNLQELINAANDFEEKVRAEHAAGEPGLPEEFKTPVDAAKASIARYLQEISLLSDLDAWTDQGGTITLMTVHLAKGLEFPGVFVTGLEEGLFPIGDTAFDQDELEEERRLAYVAITRARQRLYLTSAASRRVYGTARMNMPSRFIEEAGISVKSHAQRQEKSGYSLGQQSHDDDFNQDRPVVVATEPGPRLEAAAKVGQRIHHPDFGEGKITDKEGSGTNTKITILFNTGSRKKLLLKYAPIQIINNDWHG